jgi:hypothetical protein
MTSSLTFRRHRLYHILEGLIRKLQRACSSSVLVSSSIVARANHASYERVYHVMIVSSCSMPNNPMWIIENHACKKPRSRHTGSKGSIAAETSFCRYVDSLRRTQGAAVGPDCLTTSMARSDKFTEECRTSGRVLM